MGLNTFIFEASKQGYREMVELLIGHSELETAEGLSVLDVATDDIKIYIENYLSSFYIKEPIYEVETTW